ncbi:DUF692 domain-containing protein [soil metagenome]
MIHTTSHITSLHGIGIGLRSVHLSHILSHKPPIAWLEILADNYLVEDELTMTQLMQIRQNYPVTLHCIGMSLGSTDPVNFAYLSKLKRLQQLIEPVYISDHLSWSSIDNHYVPELLPLPYNQETLNHVVDKILHVQDFLGHTIVIENPSSYLSYLNSDITEWDFLNEIADKTACSLLIDINNIAVSAFNHHFDPLLYLQKLIPKHVSQFHLAGFTEHDHYRFDTHSTRIYPEVWDLYKQALTLFGNLPTLIEWDTDIPEFAVLLEEAHKAKNIMDKICN